MPMLATVALAKGCRRDAPNQAEMILAERRLDDDLAQYAEPVA